MACFSVIRNVQNNAKSTISEYLAGQYNKGKKNGKGTCLYTNGNKYKGDWVNDQKVGQGVFTWSDGDRYEIKYSQMRCYHLLSQLQHNKIQR